MLADLPSLKNEQKQDEWNKENKTFPGYKSNYQLPWDTSEVSNDQEDHLDRLGVGKH